jgi:phosphomannomutase
MTLKIGISGIRGIYGESLTDKVAMDFARAFAIYICKGTVVVGRDTRPSGKILEKIIIDNLVDCGINILYAGISTTPTMQVLVKKLNADGGIVITASHNPIEWNGFKFISNKGMFLNEKENSRLFSIYREGNKINSKKDGMMKKIKDADSYHIKAILDNIDIKNIRKRKFKVAIDSCNGAGSLITPRLLNELGCIVVQLNTDPNKVFPRGAEPIAENLKVLCQKVKEKKADIGFAQDPDADRLAMVTDEGVAVGEEYTLPLAASYILSDSKAGATVVTNLSTSAMLDHIARKYGAKVIRTKVGEINVVEEMIRSKAVLGGEGNGGVIYPKVICSRDSLTGIVLILNMMAKENLPISSMIKQLPEYHMIKTKIQCRTKEEAECLIKKIINFYRSEKMDLRDGVKIIFNDSWVHIRPSNTEPVVRIIAEAPLYKKANDMIGKIKGFN